LRKTAVNGDPGCGLNATLRIISGKWKPLVLFFLRDGPKRYGELKRLVQGVSDKMASIFAKRDTLP
jgi:DNA-binding HxlR family transcriptional regulator